MSICIRILLCSSPRINTQIYDVGYIDAHINFYACSYLFKDLCLCMGACACTCRSIPTVYHLKRLIGFLIGFIPAYVSVANQFVALGWDSIRRFSLRESTLGYLVVCLVMPMFQVFEQEIMILR